MWTTEGRGLIAPRPIPVRLDPGEVLRAWLTARHRVAYRRYGDRADQWGRGLLGDDSTKPVFVGLLGEIAFAKWVKRAMGIDIKPDLSDRPFGDGGTDFDLCGYQIQVKTAAADYRDLLVRTGEVASPAESPPPSFVRAHWQPMKYRRAAVGGLFGGHESRDRVVELCGWVRGHHFFRLASIEPARRGDHFNYRVLPERFKPMSALSDYVNAANSWREVSFG